MAENQNIEWKQSWRDEYLKWICGFANAQGGKIYIGTKDDGTVVGLKDSKKLLEDIPNKIQNKLGIVADVNLLTESGLEYIEIIVNPWAFPVNCDGEYHYRSGSTKQQLRGNALTNFLMAKTGMKWDAARESVFNALIHCNWADNVPIQIRIEEDIMFISNCSMLPFGWTAETLLGAHTSKPYNPDIAKVFYRAGYIESWGRGIQKICDACKNLGADEPEYIIHGEDIMVKFKALQSAKISNLKD